MLKRIVLVAGITVALGACNADRTVSSNRHLQPIPAQTVALMEEKGMSPSDPIMMRILQEGSRAGDLEGRVGRALCAARHLSDLPLGPASSAPKKREGDRQAPEGFYTVTPDLMNPNSAYYLSFNLGYPKPFRPRTRAHRPAPDGAWLVHLRRLFRHDR